MKTTYILFVVLLLVVILSGCSDGHYNTVNGIKINDVEEEYDYDIVLCYIIEYDSEKDLLYYDEVEWICFTDKKRIKELNLDAEYDFPNGFYIYNEDETISALKVSDTVKVYLVNLADSFNPYITDMEGLIDRQAEYKAPYYLKFKDNLIYVIEEQFIP